MHITIRYDVIGYLFDTITLLVFYYILLQAGLTLQKQDSFLH